MLILEGLVFSVLWSSAAVAAKIGFASGPPLALATLRFVLAGALSLLGLLVARRSPWPGRYWRVLAVLGFLNTSVYLGASFIALSVVPAGLFNLFVTVNPFLVLILSRVWLKTTVRKAQWVGLLVSAIGLVAGSWNSIVRTRLPLWGIALILFAMISMATGSIIFQRVQIPLQSTVINTWQLLFGALFLLPVAIVVSGRQQIVWNLAWWGSLIWLVVAVSLGAMVLWFHLLRRGAARASVWLLLTPIIGYALAAIFLREPFTLVDGVASALVIAGLGIAEYVKA